MIVIEHKSDAGCVRMTRNQQDYIEIQMSPRGRKHRLHLWDFQRMLSAMDIGNYDARSKAK